MADWPVIDTQVENDGATNFERAKEIVKTIYHVPEGKNKADNQMYCKLCFELLRDNSLLTDEIVNELTDKDKMSGKGATSIGGILLPYGQNIKDDGDRKRYSGETDESKNNIYVEVKGIRYRVASEWGKNKTGEKPQSWKFLEWICNKLEMPG